MMVRDGHLWEVTKFELLLEYNVEGNYIRCSRYGWPIYTSTLNWHGTNQELSISLVRTVPWLNIPELAYHEFFFGLPISYLNLMKNGFCQYGPAPIFVCQFWNCFYEQMCVLVLYHLVKTRHRNSWAKQKILMSTWVLRLKTIYLMIHL